jgi:hypothetical protein
MKRNTREPNTPATMIMVLWSGIVIGLADIGAVDEVAVGEVA